MKIACFFETLDSRQEFLDFYDFVENEKQIGSNLYYVPNQTTENYFFSKKNFDKIVIFTNDNKNKNIPKSLMDKVKIVKSPITFVRATRLPDSKQMRNLLHRIMKIDNERSYSNVGEKKKKSIAEIRNYLISNDYALKLFEKHVKRKKKKKKRKVKKPSSTTIDENTCAVCRISERDTMIASCCHYCLCSECADKDKLNDKCPLCRKEITVFLDVYH